MKLTCVTLDWDANPITHISRTDWEAGVWETLREIARPSFRTGLVVLRALERTGKTVRIAPWRDPKALRRIVNETKDNPDGVCVSGIGTPSTGPESSSAELQAKARKNTRPGDSLMLFNAQDFHLPNQKADATLLHELFHCLRIALGLDKNKDLPPPLESMGHWKGSPTGKAMGRDPERPLTQIYNNVEEFLAVMIENIYGSERNYPLRRDHLAPLDQNDQFCMAKAEDLNWFFLAPPLNNARNFLTVWHHEIEVMAQAMRPFCNEIAAIACQFNPIFELYDRRDWFLPGGRQVAA